MEIRDHRIDQIDRLLSGKKDNLVCVGTSAQLGKYNNDAYGHQTNIELSINVNVGEQVDLRTLDVVINLLDKIAKIKNGY